jgi:hypothetical protein
LIGSHNYQEIQGVKHLDRFRDSTIQPNICLRQDVAAFYVDRSISVEKDSEPGMCRRTSPWLVLLYIRRSFFVHEYRSSNISRCG